LRYIRGKGAELTKMSVRHAVIAFALLTWAHSASAHGIAGNRFFVGTITFDDPAVADEAILPAYSNLDHPAAGGNVAGVREAPRHEVAVGGAPAVRRALSGIDRCT
jgi:hypothetical protein